MTSPSHKTDPAAAAGGSRDCGDDVLITSGLHSSMLLFHRPAGWPAWVVATVLLAVALLGAGPWLLTTGRGDVAAGAYALLVTVFTADAVVLRALPARGLSFGPWKAQIFALALPRLIAGVFIAVISWLIPTGWALAILISIQALGLLVLVWGAAFEPFRLELTSLDVVTDRLAPSTSPIRLLHISDLHVERLTRREYHLLQLIDRARPDLIVVTGDYLNLSYNRDRKAREQMRWLLEQMSAPHGVYAVLGSPPVDLRQELLPLFHDLGVHLLVNEFHVVELDRNRRLLLLGIDCSHHIPTDADRLERVASQAPNGMPSVLLYHAPDLMPQASGHGVDLYLCGHTHGGQVRLPFVGALLTSSQFGKQYEMGLYRQGRTHLYVSRGVGLEGLSAPRVRFLAPPEITLVTIRGTAATESDIRA